MRKTLILLAAVMLLSPMAFGMSPSNQQSNASQGQPLYVGILIQDNVIHVGTDLGAYRTFIRELPAGSHVSVAYARVGFNNIVQPFTSNLSQAADSLRPPAAFPSMEPGSPYVSVKEYLKTFPKSDTGVRKVLVFVSNGLDPIFGSYVRVLPSADPYLAQAIRVARRDDVTIYSIFAPGAGPFHRSQVLAFSGQGALNYLSDRTHGEAFYSGSTYITARPFLKDIASRIG